MSRPDLISQEYITPVSVSTSFNASRYSGTGRTELGYSDLRPKPLSSRRKRFIGTNIGFVVLHLCAILTLALYVTVRQPQKRAAGSHGCELCDLWCTSNCSHLKTDANVGLMLISADNGDATQGKAKDLCCVERRDSLSKIYEDIQKLKPSSDYSNRKKIFDGIRLKDKWTEDDPNNWPRTSSSVLHFDKKGRRFSVSANGTFSVHSRIDFYCVNVDSRLNQQTLSVVPRSRERSSDFVDERAQLGQGTAIRNGTVIYTSTVNVIVKLQYGDSLEFLTNPSGCAFPRTLVVFQSKEE